MIIGALLTSSRTDRAHRADVRREVYAGFVATAHALRRHLAEASEATSSSSLPAPEITQRGTELLDALEIAAAAVIVSGSKRDEGPRPEA